MKRTELKRTTPLKRKTPIRKVSKKTQRLIRRVMGGRHALIDRVGKCEMCGETWGLSVHEISRGPNRQKSLDKKYCCLVACWKCNSIPLNDKEHWPESRQLYLLKESRPEDYDVGAYNTLRGLGEHRIEDHEVEAWRGST